MTGCGDTVDAEQMVRNFGRSQGKKKLLAMALCRAPHGMAGLGLLLAQVAFAFHRGLTPRHAIYLAAYRWHEVCGGQALVDLPGVSSPYAICCGEGTVQAASGSAMSARLVWNYKEFTVETRA